MDQPVLVQPAELLTAGANVAAHLERSALPTSAAPTVAAGSPVDAAAGSVAVGMQTRISALSTQLEAEAPQIQAITAAGTAGLQAQDARSAATLAALHCAGVGKALGGFSAASGVQPMGFGPGGPPLKPSAPQKVPLDLSAIRRLQPGQPGPYGYLELIPGSGVWVPDPSVSALHPGTLGPAAKAPLDLGDLVRLGPGELGPRGYMELVPGSGVWVPDPASPGFVPSVPKFPLDVGDLVRLAPGVLGPPGYVELVPHSGVWAPNPSAPH